MTYDIVDDGSDYERFLAARTQLLGASDVAALLGLSKYSTPLDVWKSKQPDAEPSVDTRFTIWGRRLEAVVADWAAVDFPQLLGHMQPSPGLLRSVEYPWLGATPDRMLDDAVVEIKTGSEYTKSAWVEEFTQAPIAPDWYQVQVQVQEFVGGKTHGYIVPLIGGNDLLEPRLVERDDAFIEIMLNETGEWWDRYIIGQTPPPATPLDDLNAMWRGDDTASVFADARMLELYTRRVEVAAEKSKLTKEDDAIKDEIRLFMGEATTMLHPETKNPLVTWKRGQAKSTLDTATLAIEQPEIFRRYQTQKPGTRSMLFK